MESVPSPCVGVCQMYCGLCIGCDRTLTEIAAWKDMSDKEKTLLLMQLETRQNGYWTAVDVQDHIKKLTDNR